MEMETTHNQAECEMRTVVGTIWHCGVFRTVFGHVEVAVEVIDNVAKALTMTDSLKCKHEQHYTM
jgi:hypothetical protein